MTKAESIIKTNLAMQYYIHFTFGSIKVFHIGSYLVASTEQDISYR